MTCPACGGRGWRLDLDEPCSCIEREIDDAVDAWHDSESELPLHEFLGWTAEEYARWFLTKVPPERGVSDAHRTH